ncbi:DUF6220 domain-containing protein [Gracilibacillus alcaliphilus]|uniref:DUF6220 domain-containing protein n=1 Tax=Gracilibacillus alcaliphilus TaxID=1401441 RepID=UPI00195D7982|nr:DUF6220 domain-containing protein [Gracilibacillus alcaliphilus]MBM7675294.1 hypothetical protein [Gracilibacillus alcaliphilus]
MSNQADKIQYSRRFFLILAWIFAVCITVQTFLAGLAIFTNHSYWAYHTTFAIWFQFIPILMLVLAFMGQLSKRIQWQVTGLFLLIVPLQYVSVHVPGIGAIHPVIALVLFWLIVIIIQKVSRLNKNV